MELCTAFLYLAVLGTVVQAASPTASAILPTLVAPSPTYRGNASDILAYPPCAVCQIANG